MEDLPFGRISALVPEFAVKDLPSGRTLMMMMMMNFIFVEKLNSEQFSVNEGQSNENGPDAKTYNLQHCFYIYAIARQDY